MKKVTVRVLMGIAIMIGGIGVFQKYDVCAAEKSDTLSGEIYIFEEKDKYNLSVASKTNQISERFSVCGNIASISSENGIKSYAVDEGNLSITVNVDNDENVYLESIEDESVWHIVSDKRKTVDTTDFDEMIGTGALIVQTSKDGKIWVNASKDKDIFNGIMKQSDPIYSTTAVQLTNGCYYRIIVAYKMERKVESFQNFFLKKDNERKEYAEIYTFYAYNKDVNTTEKLDIENAYEFGNVFRTVEHEGYYGTEDIDRDDPHNGWSIGHFYVSDYTAKTEMDDGTPVFLKEVGDKAALWFNLTQDINKCNDNDAIRVTIDPEGYDRYFQTSAMDFGHGALIVRKTNYQNKNETEVYTNYLEASATVGANTRVDLFEEGDYEVALDYALRYDKTKIGGKSVLPKTLHYRIYFKFSVRNGDCKLFIRDAETNQFINNANIAENGFYIDLAQSKYLSFVVTRDVMADSLDGLVADTKFNGAGKEGRKYQDEGIYTIKATNKYTSATTEKKIYVGNTDILKAYMKTGLSISEINEKVSAGAYIDGEGNIIEPEAEEEIEEIPEETEENLVETEVKEEEVEDEIDEKRVDDEEETEEDVPKEEVLEESSSYIVIFSSVTPVLIAVFIVILGICGATLYMKKVKRIEKRGDGKE